MEASSLSTSCASCTDTASNNVIKLCLYGEVETARLHIEPDILYFGDLIVGQISHRVLRLTNPSSVTPIYLKCVSNAAARCRPKWMQLESKASIEVLVEVRGKESGNYCETFIVDTLNMMTYIVIYPFCEGKKIRFYLKG